MVSATDLSRQLNIEPHWYALHTRHRHEKKIDARLKEKKITSYLPLHTVYRRWSDRYKRIEEPLFSCYVFVWIALRDRLPVLQTDGAVNLVSFNGIPAIIPPEQIDAIRRILERRVEVSQAGYFTPGEKVRVMRGPLHGLEGTLVCQKNNHRLIITVDGIKQAIAIEIDPHDLEPIGESRVLP
jgi:transcription antitermination factor NusG